MVLLSVHGYYVICYLTSAANSQTRLPDMYNNAHANNNKTSERTKHIDVKYHYVQEAFEFGEVSTKFCLSDDNLADLFT